MISLVEAFRKAASRYAALPAVIDGQVPLSYAALDTMSDNVAHMLRTHGVIKGDRVAISCPNSPEFVIVYLAILKTGAVVVPVNLLLSAPEVQHVLEDAGAVVWFCHTNFAASVQQLQPQLPLLRHVQMICPEGGQDWEIWLQAGQETEPVTPDLDPDQDLAAILYTSGTTGKSKGAMLSHANLLANVASVTIAMQWRSGEDRVLLVLPMFHAFAATVGLLTPLLNGCAIVSMSRFEPETVAERIRAAAATVFLGVPSMYILLLRLRPDMTDALRGLRLCVSGGAAMPVAVLEAFRQRFGLTVHEGDGPTECGPVTCVNPVGGLIKPGTVGLPVPGVEMRIVAEDGRTLPLGEVGEVAVRSASVFKGYWRQPEATRASFQDGWFLTGDLGTEDQDGYFSLVDRKKDLIIVNGMNVYPRIIEEVIYRHPAVVEVAVVGEPDDLHGELPVAHVVLSSPLTEAELKSWCKASLGRHEIPRRVYIRDQLPKNAAGKLLKRELRRAGEVERGVV